MIKHYAFLDVETTAQLWFNWVLRRCSGGDKDADVTLLLRRTNSGNKLRYSLEPISF